MHAPLLRVRAFLTLLPPPLACDRPEFKYSDAGMTSLRLPLDKCPRWPVYVGVSGCGCGSSVLLGCWEPWDSAMGTTPCKILHRGVRSVACCSTRLGVWGSKSMNHPSQPHRAHHTPHGAFARSWPDHGGHIGAYLGLMWALVVTHRRTLPRCSIGPAAYKMSNTTHPCKSPHMQQPQPALSHQRPLGCNGKGTRATICLGLGVLWCGGVLGLGVVGFQPK